MLFHLKKNIYIIYKMNPILTRSFISSLRHKSLASAGIIVPSIYSNKVYQGDVLESVAKAYKSSPIKKVTHKSIPVIDVKKLII